MKRIQHLLLAAALGALLTSSASARLRVLEDTYGRLISAELLSHKGADSELVKIRRGDGKVFDVRVDRFCERDQAEIRDWMRATSPTLDYHFHFGEAKATRAGATAFELDVRNASRDEIGDLRVVCRVVVRRRVRGGVSLGGGLYGIERSYRIEGPLRFNEGQSISTGRVRGAIGVMVQIYNDYGDVVGEYRSRVPRLSSLEWKGVPDGGRRALEADGGAGFGVLAAVD